MKARVRLRRPSPRILATASLVLSYRMLWGTPPRKASRQVAVPEGRGGLRGVGLDEAAVAVGQVQDEAVGLALHSPDDHQGLAEVALDLARGVGQGHEHLLGPAAALPDLVLDDGVLAAEPILVPPPLKDALGRVALLPGNLLRSDFQYCVNHPGAGRILSLSKGWGGGADSAAGSPAPE